MILRLLESLQPMFRNELTSDEALALAQTLKFQLRNVKFTPELLASHRYDVDKLVAHCLTADLTSRRVLDPNLQPLLVRYDQTSVLGNNSNV